MKDPLAPHGSHARRGALRGGRSSTSPAPHGSQARRGALQQGRSSASRQEAAQSAIAVVTSAAASSGGKWPVPGSSRHW